MISEHDPLGAAVRPLRNSLGEAIFGADWRRLQDLNATADYIREHRVAFEDALDSLLAAILDPDRRVGPQELRAASAAGGFANAQTGRGADRVAVLLALALERLAVLTEQDRLRARTSSVAQASPVGTPASVPTEEAPHV